MNSYSIKVALSTITFLLAGILALDIANFVAPAQQIQSVCKHR